MQVTRTRLDRCATKDCPWPLDEEIHEPWCAEISDHHHTREGTHQHHPKKGMGGNNPKSEIVAILCFDAHDRIDNRDWGNDVRTINGQRVYFVWDIHGEILLEKVIGESTGSVEAPFTDGVAPQAEVIEPSPLTLPAGSQSRGSRGASGPLKRESTPRSIHLSEPARTSPGYSSPPISEALKPNGLQLPDEFTFEEWGELAGMVAGMARNRQWWCGDLILAGDRFGERASQFLGEMGYTYETLANCVWVCRRFPLSSRRHELSFKHHAVVAKLGDEAQEWLTRATVKNWTAAELREAVYGRKPKTVRWTLEDLRERAGDFRGLCEAEGGMLFSVERFLDWLSASEEGSATT